MAKKNGAPDDAASDEEAPPTENPKSALPRPRELVGATCRMETPLGKAYVTVNRSEKTTLFEVFVNLGKAGSESPTPAWARDDCGWSLGNLAKRAGLCAQPPGRAESSTQGT